MPGECGFIIKETPSEGNVTFELATSDEDYWPDTRLHYHDVIRARDIYLYEVFKFIVPGGSMLDAPMGTIRWWEFWSPNPKKNWLNSRYCVAYSLSNHMIAK